MGKRVEQGTLRGERRARPPKVAREAVPDRILPMLARPSDYPDDEQNYAFEVKWDGIRGVVRLERGGALTIRSRNLLDITQQYPELAEIRGLLAGRSAVLDGEIVAF